MADTLLGLHHLVSNGRAHLDIKPGNILMCNNSYVLTDFGSMKTQNAIMDKSTILT